MQPAWSRYLRRESAPPPARPVVPRVTRGAAPVGRTAGVVAPRVLTLPVGQLLSVPARADFASAVPGSAFWWVSPDALGPGSLWRASGARVVFDLRGELGLSPRPAMWTPDVLAALRSLVQARGGTFSTAELPRIGEALPAEWLRLGIWWAYERDNYAQLPAAVQLPPSRLLPRIGVDLGNPGGPAEAATGVDLNELSPNPWLVRGDEIDVVGSGGGATPMQGGASSGGGSSTWLLILAAAAAALND